MCVYAESIKNFIVISFDGNKFCKTNVDDFKGVFQLKFEEQFRHFIVDLTNITFFDSSALGAVVGALKAVQPVGDIVLVVTNQQVTQLLKLTRMDKIFKVFEDVETAKNYIDKK